MNLDGVGDVDLDDAFDLGVDGGDADAQVKGVVKVHVADAVNHDVNVKVYVYVNVRPERSGAVFSTNPPFGSGMGWCPGLAP